MKKNTRPMRTDADFFKDLDEILKTRIKKGFITNRKKMNFPHITKIARRTESYRKMLEELKTKPERKNG